jgi:hypothetical protein
MRVRWAFYLLLVISMTVLLAPAAQADVYWESEMVSKGLPGQQDGTTIEKYYFTPNRSRFELGNGSIMITNLDTMTMYNVDPGTGTYMEMKMDELAMPENLQGIDPEAFQLMMEAMGQGVRVTETNEAKTINGYKCRKYNVSFMGMNSDYWASKDVKAYAEMREIASNAAKGLEKSPMLRQLNVMDIMNKIDGFPVQIVMRIMGGETVSTLRKVEQRELPADLFRVPEGYRQTAMQE